MLSIFDILTDKYKTPEFDSIKSHLYRLLNSRRGSLQHLPDFGLPDVTEIYQGLPYSIENFVLAIKQTIEKYEPRLKNVRVTCSEQKDRDCVLHLEISGILTNDNKIKFTTYFVSGSMAEIERINSVANYS